MWYNKVEYITDAGVYCTTHDVKVPFWMPEFSSSKITNHRFHVDNERGKSSIWYDVIIGYELMVQIGLTDEFKSQVLQWDGTTVHMKEPRNLPGKSDITKREMREVVMQTADPASTQEATELMLKILDSNYVKAEFKQTVNNDSQLNAEERTLLIRFIEDFKESFDGTLDEWATEPVNLDLTPDSKPFNSIYYPVPIINK